MTTTHLIQKAGPFRDLIMKVNVIGTGYVGLVSGVCLASKGHQVSCFDLDSETIRTLNKGIPHIKEAGLQELLTQVIAKGLFVAKHVSENQTNISTNTYL